MKHRRRQQPRERTLAAAQSWSWLALLTGVLMLKVALALMLAGHPLLQPTGELDSGEYWRLAARVTSGDVLLEGTPFYVAPLYIYVLAALQALTGGSHTMVLVAQAGFGTAAVGLVGWTVAQWSTPRAAGLAMALVALTGVVALQEAVVLQSALDPLLVAGCLAGLTCALQRRSVRAWLICGAALALFALNRPNAWLLGVLCLAAAAAPGPVRRSSVAALALGVAIVIVPFTLRTAAATGTWQVLPGHGGLNVYIGNHPGATGTYTVVDGIRPSIEGQREDMRRVAEAAAGRPLSDAAVSAHFARRAFDWWRADPLAALRLTAYKSWLAVHSWELPVNVSYAWFREQVWLLRMLPVGAWLLLPLAAAAWVAGPIGVTPSHADAWRWFRWVLPVYLAGVALVFVVDRYRAPALVMTAVFAAPLTATWLTRLQDVPAAIGRRRAVAAGAAGCVVLAAGLVPLPFHLGMGDADVRMALHAISQGQDTEAQAWLARATTRHREPGVAWFRAGLAWQAKQDWSRSEAALREARRHDPDVAEVGFALAGSLMAQGKGAEAVPLLRQAEAAAVRPDRTRLDLALALWQAGQEDEARRLLQDGVPDEALPLWRSRALAAADARQVRLADWLLDTYRARVSGDAEVAEKLGLTRAAQRRWDDAALDFEEAARLDPRRATVRFNLALVRLQQGRRADAIALLEAALRIDPGYTQAAGALREIRQ